MTRVLAIIVVLSTILFVAFAQDRHKPCERSTVAIEHEIRDVEDQTREAMLKSNPAFIESHSTANVYRVGPDGTVANRDQLLKVWRMEKFSAIDIQERETWIYGSTALVLEKVAVKGRGGEGRQIDGEYRLTRLWVSENGVWKVAALHLTRIAYSPPSSLDHSNGRGIEKNRPTGLVQR